MKVSELIEWLKTQDQDATVEVLQLEHSTGYGGDSVSVVAFDPEKHSTYTDLRNNPFVKPDAPYFNSRTLLLGDN